MWRALHLLSCQTNRNHLTYILRPRRPAPRHSALNPTILTRVVSHTRPKKHLRSLLRSWRDGSGETPILGSRGSRLEDSRDFLLCQPITPRWHFASFGIWSQSSTLGTSAPFSSSPLYHDDYFVCGAQAEASSSGELEKATQASNQEATEVLKTEEASHNPDLH